jgi:hypothetical protein
MTMYNCLNKKKKKVVDWAKKVQERRSRRLFYERERGRSGITRRSRRFFYERERKKQYKTAKP